jgi:hypothetical protein
MNCTRCGATAAEQARFCAVCGSELRGPVPGDRADTYVASPGQPVWSTDVVTSLMPLTVTTGPQTYRFALAAAFAVPVAAALAGLLPMAIAAAALAVPVVLVLYLYDVNEWEDQPVAVLLATIALSGVLAVGITWWWQDVLLGGPLTLVEPGDGSDVEVKTLLVLAVVVPLVSEVAKEFGPLWLASRPRFDDLIDALTFGIVSGAAYAAAETLVLNRELFVSGAFHISGTDTAVWLPLVVTAGLVKPVIYGAASGIALAAFSGIGERYAGFTPRYLGAFGVAVGANALFHVGVYLSGLAPGATGVILGLVWGLLLAGGLLLALRYALQRALVEGALEAARSGEVPRWAPRNVAFCAECDYPLDHEASFCSTCGASVRCASKLARRANADPDAMREEALR